MISKIYQSTGILNNSVFSNKYKIVEVVEYINTSEIFIYYLGCDIPFYSVFKLPYYFTSGLNCSCFEEIKIMLEKYNIIVENWREVNHQYLYECNSMISKSIRPQIDNMFFAKREGVVLSFKKKMNVDNRFKGFEGNKVFVHLLFEEFESNDTSKQSFVTYGECILLKDNNSETKGFMIINKKEKTLLLVELAQNVSYIIIDPIHQIKISDGTAISFSISDNAKNIINVLNEA